MNKRTKSMRKRAKAYNRKDVPRAPSGAPSRSTERYAVEAQQNEKDARVVVLMARQRVYGLNDEQAEATEAGSSLGRLLLAGALHRGLYVAGTRFARDVWRYHQLTGIPHPSPRAMEYNRVPGRGMDRSGPSVAEAANRYMLTLGAIQQVDRAGRPVETTVKNICILDHSADNWPRHMIATLCQGLGALENFYASLVEPLTEQAKSAQG